MPAPAPSIEGLRRLYQAWRLPVPFDNVAKMIALREGARTLPGSSSGRSEKRNDP